MLAVHLLLVNRLHGGNRLLAQLGSAIFLARRLIRLIIVVFDVGSRRCDGAAPFSFSFQQLLVGFGCRLYRAFLGVTVGIQR